MHPNNQRVEEKRITIANYLPIPFENRKYDQYEPIQEEKISYNIIEHGIRHSQSGATVREL